MKAILYCAEVMLSFISKRGGGDIRSELNSSAYIDNFVILKKEEIQ